ncbi:hypothetical protein [Promicromonospora soli]|uniref:Uncharacterized protein n=1 Tax=Promicromonospora soli TaxID=2035533 RepID=A0A919FGA3_9MICO|nr:hypothetical protein [Promicromonospora soli]GHH64879.1 hypothetical protein GCM10017772_02090 [Promicromonospora soli]
MIRRLVSWAFSLVSFGGGGAAAVLIYPLLAIPLYMVLVVVAILTDTSTGGPFALPLMLVVATVVGIVYTVLAYVAVGVREPAMTIIEALAWSARIAVVGLPAWAVIASVWFGLRIVRGAVRLAENSVVHQDRAVVGV